VISISEVIRPRSVLLLALLSLLASWCAAQAGQPARQPTKSKIERVKPAEVHFEDIASQARLSALNVFGSDTHKEYIIETTGNGAIIAHLVMQVPGAVKSGVMIREDLTSNSKYVILSVQQAYGARFEMRDATGANSVEAGKGQEGKAAPIWLKLMRVDNTFTSYLSSDGTTWIRPWPSMNIPDMAPSVYIGLAQCGVGDTALQASTFDSVSIEPNVR